MYIFIFVLVFFTLSYAHEDSNLDIILDFSYLYRNIEDKDYLKTEVPDYLHSYFDHYDHTHAIRKNGFNLNYGEIAFLVPVKKKIDLFGTLHLTEDTFEIEEFYGLYKNKDFIFKAGKFRSETGILNKQHDHEWYFYELPVVYLSFFSVHGLNEKGLQMRFSNRNINTGIELLNGNNNQSFGYGNASLYTIFFKSFFRNSSVGISYVHGKNTMKNNVKIYIFETILDLKRILFQGEYLLRDSDNILSGYYFFVIFKLSKTINIGYRYEYLDRNLFKHSFVANIYDNPYIQIRFQYNLDRTRFLEKEKLFLKEFVVEVLFRKTFY